MRQEKGGKEVRRGEGGWRVRRRYLYEGGRAEKVGGRKGKQPRRVGKIGI